MPQNFVRWDAGQGFLMPPDVREWLPAGHLAWGLLGLAGELDLPAFTGWYRSDGQGRPAYHPAMMVTLICYCFCKGIRSSRGIEAATFDDVGARVICGNLHPDHATAHRFIARHEAAVRGLLAVSVAACAREGLVSAEVVAGDGTKVRASASAGRNLTLARLEEETGELEKAVAAQAQAWLAQVLEAGAAQDALPGVSGGDDGPGSAGGRKAAAQRVMLEGRRAARDLLAAREQEREQGAQAERQGRVSRLEAQAARARAAADALAAAADEKARRWARRAADKAAAGSRRGPRGRPPAAAEENVHVRRAREQAAAVAARLEAARAEPPAAPGKPLKINVTDPSSMMMQAKNGGFGQQHNVQALACRFSQVILAIGTHPSPVDVAALHPLLEAGLATLDAAAISDPIKKALFDAGYASDANFTKDCEADLYVAVTKEARQAGRLRDGRKPATRKDSWQQMDAKLATPQGKALYKQRSATIEPVFAQLFARLGRHLNYRGDRAGTELSLWGTSHNLLKALRARAARTTRAPQPARQALAA
jgi:transposase